MTSPRFLPLLASAVWCAANALAATVIRPVGVTLTGADEFFPASHLIDGSGLEFQLDTGDRLPATWNHWWADPTRDSWVSSDPGGLLSDWYANSATIPTLVLDLGQDTALHAVHLWAYSCTAGWDGTFQGNSARTLEFRFNTAAQGNVTFGGPAVSVTVDHGPINETPAGFRLPRQDFAVGSQTARWVELRITDNWFVAPGDGTGTDEHGHRIRGGDRVGLGEVRFSQAMEPAGAKRWEFQTGGAVGSSPAIGADGTVYVGSSDHKVYALDGGTGAKRWEFATGGEVFSSPAIGPDGTVYVGSYDRKVYALDGMAGGKRWEFATGNQVHGSPALGADGTVFVGSYDHKVYALDGATGARRWDYETGGYVSSSPAIGPDGTVYVECLDGKIYALNGATGQKAWEFQTDFMVGSSPAIGADNTVYVGSAWRVYALNGATGLKRWEYSGGGLSHSSPAIGADGTVYVGCTNELRQLTLTALNGATGEKRWEFLASGPVESCPAIGADGTVYVGSWDQKVYALDGATGQERWEFATAGAVVSSPAIGADGTVYVGSGDGKVYALGSSTVGGLATSPWPKFHRDAQNTGRVAGAQPGNAPSLPAQPEDVTAVVGADVSFAVAASGTAPLAYAWRKDDAALAEGGRITGVHTSQLSLRDVQTADAGRYQVVVTNQFGVVASRNALLTVTSGLPGQERWGFLTGVEIFSSPAIGTDGTIYFGCNDHFVYAVDGVTGVKKWSFETGAWVRSSPAVGSDGTVYVGSDDPYVYALDGATGALRWRTLLGAASGLSMRDSSPAVGLDGTVYIGDGAQNLLALDGSTGAVKWSVPIGWNRSCPAIGADGTVYVGSGGGSLYAVSGTTGAVKWQFTTGGDVRSSPAVGGNGLIYVGSYDQRVHAVDAATGVARWSFLTGREVCSSPAMGTDGTVYVGSHDGNVYALDGMSGAKRWEYAMGDRVFGSPAVGTDGNVYIGSHLGNVVALDGATGSPEWVYQTGGDAISSPNIGADGTVYVGSYDGMLHALSSTSVGGLAPSPWPKFRANARNTGRVAREEPAQAPGVTVEPKDVSAVLGASVTFAVTASGTPPLTYQWREDGSALVGFTNASLVLRNVQFDQAGGYSVVVANSLGAVTSRVATLTVRLPDDTVVWSVNGHAYRRVDVRPITWLAARAAAEAAAYEGMPGHLATINSAEENRFLTEHALLGNGSAGLLDGYWLGGYQRPDSAEPGGDWRWVTGEPFVFTNWGPGHPEDREGLKDTLMFWAASSVKSDAEGLLWADIRGLTVYEKDGRGYVVEYEATGSPPEVVRQPQDQTVAEGGWAVIEVSALGTLPRAYQWHKDGVPLVADGRITGVGGPRLSIANMVASDVGRYSVVVSNLTGTVQSRTAALTLPSGVAFHLSFDNTLEGAQGEQPTTTKGITFVPGVLGMAAWIRKDSSLIYDSAGNIATTQGSLDCWVKPTWSAADLENTLLSWGGEEGARFVRGGDRNLHLWFNQYTEGHDVAVFYGIRDWASNVWHHVALTWKSATPGGPPGRLRIFLDGGLKASKQSTNVIWTPATLAERLQVGGDGEDDPSRALNGILDELRISDVERSAAEIAQAYGDGLMRLAPGVVSPPESRTNEVGAMATFAVLASGHEPLSYLWHKDNAPLVNDGRVSGVTNRTLTVADCQVFDAGAYSATVRNPYGQVTSAPAVLTIVSSPIRYVTNLVWVETLAGSGVAGGADGTGTQAQFNHPNAGAVDQAGFVYIGDTSAHRVRKISPTGEVSTLAGTGMAGHADGPGATAQFNEPIGLCVDAAGTVYVVEAANHCVRKITPDGQVTTLAGNLTAGHRDGPGAQAQFNMPNDVTMDAAGNLYVTEFDNHTVRQVTPDGTVSTWVGSRTAGYQDGPREQARLTQPGGIACDAAGNLYVTEWGGQRVRKVSADGLVSTVAGTGEPGYQDGPVAQARFNQPDGIAVDTLGNLWITDAGNHAIRRISVAGVVETVAGTGTAGYVDGEGDRAQFGLPAGIGRAGDDTFCVADWWNHVVRRVILPRPVEIVAQPVSRQVWLAQDLTFRVSAEGTPPLGYAWFKDGVALSEGMRVEGVNTPELGIRLSQPEDAGSYWAVVTNRAGARSSTAATLAVIEPEPGRATWEFTADGIVTGCPAIGWDGTLYVTWSVPDAEAGGLHALDVGTGQRKWTFNAEGWMGGDPAVGPDGTVFAESSRGFLYALAGTTGALKWKVARTGYAGSPAIAGDGAVVAKLGDGVHAFEGATGVERWQFAFATGTESLPVIAPNGTVYVGSTIERLWALDLTTGLIQWSGPVSPMGVGSPPALGPDGTLFVSSFSSEVSALDGGDGKVKWRFSSQGRFMLTSPVLGADGTVYVGSAQATPGTNYVEALDGRTGLLRWEFTDSLMAMPFPPALAEDGTLYVASGGRLRALDAATGARRRLYTVQEALSAPPALSEQGWLFAGGWDRLYAFRVGSGLAYAPWPKHRGDAQNSGRYSCRAENAAILYQPKRRVLSEGEAGRLEVRLRPQAALALQWWHDSVPVPDGTNAVLAFAAASRQDEGQYTLVASNALCRVESETIVAIASNVKPQYYPGWRWEGGEGAVTVQASTSVFGPWTDVYEPPPVSTSGHYIETNPASAELYYRLRQETGETTARFTATALIPGWWYAAPVGTRHRIEYVWEGSGWTNWVGLTEFTLPATPFQFLDTEAFEHPRAVYRSTPVP